jgi:hypothetical protein
VTLAENKTKVAMDATPSGGEATANERPSVNEAGEEFPRQDQTIELAGRTITRRPAHYGLDIQFEDRAGDLELGRLTESTVWVNRAHPAYRRAQASHSIGYHIALSVAMALAPLAVEPAYQQGFITTFLSRWGEALDKPSPHRKGKRA